jgi:four helix bundle protein
MINNNIPIQKRTADFAVRCVKAYCELNKRHFDDAGKVLAKQFLRSSTSIGANCAESEFAQSNADYISKLSIALKEAGETRFWINLMIDSEIVSQQKFSSLLEENNRIIRILINMINKLKDKVNR